MSQFLNTDCVDAVVIGTGAGGAPIISRLAQAGLSVVALEAGKFWDPKKDFATDELEQNKLFWNYERLSAGKDPIPFGKNNSGIGVGGSTLHYTAYTPRPQPDDFKIKSEFGLGKDWPIDYVDLEPYFDELELFLGISGPSPYPWGPRRKVEYPLAPLPLNGAAQLMQSACADLNIKTAPAPNAILSAPYFQENVGWRNGCINRGFCQAGCNNGGKGSMDVTFIKKAIHFGAEIRPECFVKQIETKNGKVTAVVYLHEGVEKRQLCKHVFLCGGAIESPRMLLINNLSNRNQQVGKNFMANVGAQLWGEYDQIIHPYKGIPASIISEDMHRPKDANFAGGYLLQSLGIMPVTYAGQIARGIGEWGSKLRERMYRYKYAAGIDMHGECLPQENNYLELSQENDVMGLPKPRIFFTNGSNEINMEKHGIDMMEKIWSKAGVKNTFLIHRNAHILGTCSMGISENDSVVNHACQSWEIPNLYICDASVFTGSLSVNPALTIMAIALRTADLFLEKN